jgi:hypothetical protein
MCAKRYLWPETRMVGGFRQDTVEIQGKGIL